MQCPTDENWLECSKYQSRIRDMNFPPNPKTKRIKFRATDSIYNSKNTM